MGGIAQRIATVFRAKANRVLDEAEDPREVLDLSYTQQTEMLGRVRRGVADVATSRKRVESQAVRLEEASGRLEEQARRSLEEGREDLAREALSRRSGVVAQLADLRGQEAALRAEEERLALASQRLQARVESFRTRKETLKAAYTAAEAQTRISEAVSGIGEEMGEVGLAVQRARDRTDRLQARAAALDELLASGTLEDAALPPDRDGVRAELDALARSGEVEAELARLRTEQRRGEPAEGER
jgi:phage shock protein A